MRFAPPAGRYPAQKEIEMSFEKQVQETVKLAKKQSLTAFEAFLETGDILQPQDELDRIIAKHKWLCENFAQAPVNRPGTRARMGWSKEALDAVQKKFA